MPGVQGRVRSARAAHERLAAATLYSTRPKVSTKLSLNLMCCVCTSVTVASVSESRWWTICVVQFSGR